MIKIINYNKNLDKRKFHTSLILYSNIKKDKIEKDKWLNEKYDIKDFILKEQSIKESLSKFFVKLTKSNITKNNYIYLMGKFKTVEGEYKTLSYIQKFNKDDFNKVQDTILKFYNKKGEYYEWTNISEVIFLYKICSPGTVIAKSKIVEPIEFISEKKGKSILNFINISGVKLPNTMDFSSWGIITYHNENISIVRKEHSDLEYIINSSKVLNENNEVTHYLNNVDLRINDEILFSFKDILNNNNYLDTFSRNIKFKNKDEQIYVFEGGKLVYKKIPKNVKYLTPLLKDKKLNNNIIVMDVETRDIDSRKRAYCISIFDGIKIKTFFLTDYNSEDDLLESSIKYLMREKYNKYKVYLHNFSKFDSAFLIKTLSKLSYKPLNPKTRNDKIIQLKFLYNKNYYIIFRDSLLLLPAKLSKLAKNFGEEDKGVFPYKFVNNPIINLDYDGKFPRFHFFSWENIFDTGEYLDYIKNYFEYKSSFKHKSWNLKLETIKYCENDVKILYNILIKFNKLIFEKFNIDGLKYPTLSSLSFAIYRTKYLKTHKIPIITGNLYDALKLGYTGGSVDVYKPYGKNIKGYDVNALYPNSMLRNDMPTGIPKFFEGDVYKYEKNPFGFFEVEVNAPLDLYVPILQKIIHTIKGFRTIAPVGTWTGTYFSEEIAAAQKLGYTFKILRGFLFEKKNIFEDFVKDINKHKENSDKNSADYIIYKLILNSLYGRFALKPLMENTIIMTDESFDNLITNDYIIPIKYYDLKDQNKKLVTFYDLRQNEILNFNSEIKISVSISAAITAYARIYMSFFKNLYKDNLFYSDTDSLYLNIEMDKEYLSDKEIGKFKLEKSLMEGTFLTAKMYGGKYKDKNGKIKDFSKIKGLKSKVKYSELLPLLFKNKHISKKQEKWHRDINDSSIIVKNIEHKLELSSFKRRIIYDEKNRFVNTKPIVLQDSEIVNID